MSIKGEQAEILEAMAMATSAIVSKPLRSVGVPKGALVAAVIRKEQIIIPPAIRLSNPTTASLSLPRREAILQVEKILAVKLEFF